MAESRPTGGALPPDASLEYLRKSAKRRLKWLREAAPDVRLADAQLEVARGHGFASWRAMIAAVPAATAAQVADRRRRLFRKAVTDGRVTAVRRLLRIEPALANAAIFSFDSRALAHVNGNTRMMDALIAAGADVNARSAWWAGGWGVLDACDPAAADALIARGAVVDVFAAARLGRIDRLRVLVAADAQAVHARGGDGGRPLHFAESVAAMDVLLTAGADVDARCVDHESTAAQWAVPRHQDGPAEREAAMRRTRALIERGAAVDVFMCAAVGDTQRLRGVLAADPSAVAARVGSPSYAPCPDAPGRHIYVYKLGEGRSAYDVARLFGQIDCADMLRAHSPPKERFLAACATGDEADARHALARTPGLMSSLTPQDHAALPVAAWAGDTAAVRLMLDLGFDVRAVGPDTGTALHCAAWHGRADLVRLVLDHPAFRADAANLINATEPTHGSTPLGWCCHGSAYCHNPAGDYPAVAGWLLAAGGTPGHNRVDATPAVRRVIDGVQTHGR